VAQNPGNAATVAPKLNDALGLERLQALVVSLPVKQMEMDVNAYTACCVLVER